MTYRADGSDGGTESSVQWSRRRAAAKAVENAAMSIELRPGSDTVIGAQALIDALDAYWQARYGGRVIVVKGEEEAER